MSRADGKRPDGMTLVPLTEGKLRVWDATVVNTVAETYLDQTEKQASKAAEAAERKKITKYSFLEGRYLFVPLGIETFGPMGPNAFIYGKTVQTFGQNTLERRSGDYLNERLSIAVQRANAACVLGPKSRRRDSL